MGPRIRLALAAVAFASWLGWLAYLAATSSRPVVVSRPQLLQANLHVVATLSGTADHPTAEVRIVEVLWPKREQAALPKDTSLKILDLPTCGPAQGWHGPGTYLLLLTKTDQKLYMLTPIPASPGYPPPKTAPEERLRLYPATDQTLSQARGFEAAL